MTRTRITTDGITDASVTTGKLADASVSTAKLIGQAVTYAKMQFASATNVLLGRSTAGSGVIEEIPLSSAGRALIDDADATAQRATLGLGTMATATAADYLPLAGGAITGTVSTSANFTVTGILTAQGILARRGYAALGAFRLSRAEGTSSAQTAIAAGVECGQIAIQGYDGTAYREIATISGFATDVPTSTSSPGKLSFRTTPVGAVAAASRMEIYPDGSQHTVIPGGTTLYPSFACRAWVNFNGTGTPDIRGSGNVSSITDNGVGDYTVNFTTAMADANYTYTHAYSTESNGHVGMGLLHTLTAASLRVVHYAPTNGAWTVDKAWVNIAVFR